MKYLITISYDGSKYHGLQKLKNKHTVQGELEKILSELNETPVSIKAASRTDRGVHALKQKCHFELNKDITPYKLRYYINRSAYPYLHVIDCKIVDDKRFHSRFSSKGKKYLYRINIGDYDPIISDYVYNYNKELDIDKMKEMSKHFLGMHDFQIFVTGKKGNCTSNISSIKISQKKEIVNIEIKGKSFYTHMVRNIVGVLILIGSNKLSENDLKKMIDNQERVVEYPTAPPQGLYLQEIYY